MNSSIPDLTDKELVTLFAQYAGSDAQKWAQLVGRKVVNEHLGEGVVVSVRQRNATVVMFYVTFGSPGEDISAFSCENVGFFAKFDIPRSKGFDERIEQRKEF